MDAIALLFEHMMICDKVFDEAFDLVGLRAGIPGAGAGCVGTVLRGGIQGAGRRTFHRHVSQAQLNAERQPVNHIP